MCDYPFFIPQVVLFANSSLFWFKVTNEHREFRNYLIYNLSNLFLSPDCIFAARVIIFESQYVWIILRRFRGKRP